MEIAYLRKETKADQNQESVAVAWCRPQLAPRVLFIFLLKGNGLLDFIELDIYKSVVLVTLCVVFGQNHLCLLTLGVRDQPSWRLGHEPNKCDLEQRRDGLQQARRAPRPVSVDVVCSVRDPGSDERAKVPKCVVDGRVYGSVLGMDELGDQERRRAVGNGDAEAEEETSYNEQGNVETERQEGNADQHDGASNHNSHSSTEKIGYGKKFLSAWEVSSIPHSAQYPRVL